MLTPFQDLAYKNMSPLQRSIGMPCSGHNLECVWFIFNMDRYICKQHFSLLTAIKNSVDFVLFVGLVGWATESAWRGCSIQTQHMLPTITLVFSSVKFERFRSYLSSLTNQFGINTICVTLIHSFCCSSSPLYDSPHSNFISCWILNHLQAHCCFSLVQMTAWVISVHAYTHSPSALFYCNTSTNDSFM